MSTLQVKLIDSEDPKIPDIPFTPRPGGTDFASPRDRRAHFTSSGPRSETAFSRALSYLTADPRRFMRLLLAVSALDAIASIGLLAATEGAFLGMAGIFGLLGGLTGASAAVLYLLKKGITALTSRLTLAAALLNGLQTAIFFAGFSGVIAEHFILGPMCANCLQVGAQLLGVSVWFGLVTLLNQMVWRRLPVTVRIPSPANSRTRLLG